MGRLETVGQAAGLSILVWALLPNHAHLLVRTGRLPLATAMRRLLTGYAGAFNRRHRRVGHLFQGRYKSILVEEDPYLRELVRYIHLNPLRAGVVGTLAELGRYAWSSHAALVGRADRPWQAAREVLACFGTRAGAARRAYVAYLKAGVTQGRRAEFQGGGLRRSAGGWAAVKMLRRGRERWAADERILGSSAFVEEMRRRAEAQSAPVPRAAALAALPQLVQRCATALGVTAAELQSGSRRRVVVRARAVVSLLVVRDLGLSFAYVARALGISSPAVHAALRRGEGVVKALGLRAADLLPTVRKQLK